MYVKVNDLGVRALPIINRVLSALRPNPKLSAFAETVEIICPEEVGHMPGVLMDAADWCLVEGHYEGSSGELERKRVGGGEQVHGATVKYEFKNVLAAPSGFHVLGGTYSGLGGGYMAALRTKEVVRRKKGMYASSYVISKFFGHWLTDGLSTSFLNAEGDDLYLWTDPRWTHAPEYLNLLDIKRIEQDYVHFESLIYYEDIGQNSNRRARLRRLKEQVIRASGSRGGGFVYLRRGRTGVKREISNEQELIAIVVRYGFQVVDVTEPLEKMLAVIGGAKVTISIEGSNFAHLMLASRVGATHIVINPSDGFNNVFADYLPAFGDRMATVVAVRDERGYKVNLNQMIRLLEDILEKQVE